MPSWFVGNRRVIGGGDNGGYPSESAELQVEGLRVRNTMI